MLVVAVMAVAPAVTPQRSARAQSEGSPCGGPVSLANGGFEDPEGQMIRDPARTTCPGGARPARRANRALAVRLQGVPAAMGDQFAELSANQPSRLYRSCATAPGEELSYAFNHRGRNGVDTMESGSARRRPAEPGASGLDLEHGMAAGPRHATRVPPNQTTTRFGFAAIANASGNPSVGNFLDGVPSPRHAARGARQGARAGDGQRALRPAGGRRRGDRGGRRRRRLGAGALPLSAVTVSERGAAGTSLDDYASAIRCVDADSASS